MQARRCPKRRPSVLRTVDILRKDARSCRPEWRQSLTPVTGLDPMPLAQKWLRRVGPVPGFQRKADLTMFTNPKQARRAAGILAIGVLLALGPAKAAHAAEAAEDPAYGSTFGRVCFLEGHMTLQRAVDGESLDANVNDPVAAGDRLLNGDGRAEIGLADGSTIWLDVG